MTNKEKNDLLFVCSLIEYIGRRTHNHVKDVVNTLGKEELERQLKYADVNHCLTMEENFADISSRHQLQKGVFDSVGTARDFVPSRTAIGGVYRRLITNLQKPGDDVIDILIAVYNSFISEKISNFNGVTFYQNQSYIYHSYLEGKLLD